MSKNKFVLFLIAVMICTMPIVEAGTCICSSGATWNSCPHGGACHSWCQKHGGVFHWSGPGYKEILFVTMVLCAIATFMQFPR